MKIFLKFINERGDFKRAFEDIMFSTRVILKDKEEYVLFIGATHRKRSNRVGNHNF